MRKHRSIFDIHCHTFNLSHPNLYLFVKRLMSEKLSLRCFLQGMKRHWFATIMFSIAYGVLFILLPADLTVFAIQGFQLHQQQPHIEFSSPTHFLYQFACICFLCHLFGAAILMAAFRALINQNSFVEYWLTLFKWVEYDIGDLLEKTWQEIASLMNASKLRALGVERVVLTPLLIDFSLDETTLQEMAIANPSIHLIEEYPKKPLEEQVCDVLNGIGKFFKQPARQTTGGHSKSGLRTLLEVYPFLGVNPRNYSSHTEFQAFLDTYFGLQPISRDVLQANMGKFDGNLTTGKPLLHFAGIKVYPLLGFNPWPNARGEEKEMQKVCLLYEKCERQRIPITTHCSETGFVICPSLKRLASPQPWINVLERFPKLKLNFAHFGRQDETGSRKWNTTITDLILDRKYNVYTDIAYRGIDDSFYRDLIEQLNDFDSRSRRRILGRLLFGSDFLVNLVDLKSYSEYLTIFTQTPHLTLSQKWRISSRNPDRFLFGG